ncbi:DUF885 domain-containing protein [Solimonas marina]|uniref:DUF885 domain-containing protein n=1 Tax=Solimonas marina TaxID=2714601 RepID=A0A970B863_9GAMM|nr:DUF885 domain-containing protein [Solimonas marina]NKF21081.1 DUF885 domain-containing protein [Solimonas marina]
MLLIPQPASRALGAVAVAALLFGVAACASKPATESVASAPASTPAAAPSVPVTNLPPWADHLKQYEEAYFVANPTFAVSQGRHEFDGHLPDWSAAGLQQQVEWLQQQRKQAQAYTDAMLTPQQRFEREYLLARIDGDLFWLQDAAQPFHNPAFYTGSLDPSVYLSRPYAPLEARMKAFIAYARAVPAAAAEIRANLQTPMPKTFVQYGIAAFAGYADFYRKDVPAIFADIKDPDLQVALAASIAQAADAMQGLADWMKTLQASANDDFALGPDRFAKMLYATERVDTPLPELEKIGRADLQRNLDALKQACAQYAPGKTLHDCVLKMNHDKPKDGPVEEARKQLVMLRQFVADHQIVTIPSDERALVHEAPPYNSANSAYIDVPGPFDKGMPSTYYIAPPDPSWSKADQEAYIPGKADLLFTSVHEVWPGHFLQFLHSNRSPFQFGQLFVGYAFAEGWAHYAEQMMWDAGLGNGDPETHVGQLSNALLRDVRFLCAIGMHTQGMSVQTCETLFREQAFQDPGNARQQAARGTYDPAYLNYTMGKLMIMKLRADWTASRGGRDAWRAFHDQFLSYGGPPIPLVREQMLGDQDDGALFAE